MYNKYFTMKRSELKEAIKAEITSVLSENRYDINDPNSPMGKLSDEYESSGLKGIVDKYGLDVVLMILSSGEYGDRLNESVLSEGTWSSGTHNEIGSFIQDVKNLREKYYDIVGSDDVFDGLDMAEEAAREMMKKELEKNKSDVTFDDIREDEMSDEEKDKAASKEAKKKDSVATISNKLQKLTAKMKKKAKEFKEAEGKAKDKIKDELKDMTAEKKKLEKGL